MRIITCCSRSGSSFVCQLLHELGANFGEPDKLVKPDEWNKKGYFEDRSPASNMDPYKVTSAIFKTISS